MQQYKKYKDSGIIWLGKMPEHWKIRKGKWIFKKENRPIFCNDEIITCFRDGQVTLRINRRLDGFTNAIKEIGYQGIEKGDLVIHNMDAFAGAIGVSDSRGKATPVYSVCTPFEKGLAVPFYYAYLLRNLARNGLINSLAKGIRERSTDFRYSDFGILEYYLPPIEEQKQIVIFLDKKCKEIDKAIKQKEQIIELLKERQQAIIQRIVTRGITSDIELKDSGVNWIGLIPKHWKVQKLKYALNQVNIKLPTVGSELPYIGMENVESWTGKFIESDSEVEGLANYFNTNNVLFGKLRPYLAKTYLPNHNGLCSTEFIVYDVLENNASYIQRLLMTPEFINIVNSSTYGSKMPRANSDFIGNIKIALPLPKEQKQIAKHLEIIANKTEQTISLKKQEIELLKEYKQSLINDVVTGKIKIGTNEK